MTRKDKWLLMAVGAAIGVAAGVVGIEKDELQIALISAALGFIGVHLIRLGWHDLAGATESEAWSKTSGRIVRTDIQEFPFHYHFFHVEGATSEPVIEYVYNVAGTTYTGSRIGFRTTRGFLDRAAKAVLAKYPVGKSVLVNYDPAAPENSVLESVRSGSSRRLWAGLAFVVFAGFLSAMGKFEVLIGPAL
jgi:Protein of unknown function (DUF3592)